MSGISSCGMTRQASGGAIKNVGTVERVGSAFAGGLFLLYGLERTGLSGLLLTGLGAGLLYRGATGHCGAYQLMGYSSASSGNGAGVPAQAGFKFERSLLINRPADELFDFWRDLSNLPQVMRHIESVKEIDSLRSHWVAQGPMRMQVEWDAEIHNIDPGRMIAWRSLPGGDVDTAGSVHFEQRGDRGTEVRVSLKYNPPGGKLGANIAWLMGKSVEHEIESDLQRFKQAMEAGTFAGTR